ncbi:hypothetical protein ACFE04_011701 [Oxalis oulophora]
MGNYKFRFSDMIPNVWFYKLKDMNTTTTKTTRKKQQQQHNQIKKNNNSNISTSSQKSQPKYSYYFSTQPKKPEKFYYNISPKHSKGSDICVLDSPRRSSKKKTRRKTIYKPSPSKLVSSEACRCHVASTGCSNSSPDYSPLPVESSPEVYYYDESIPSASDCDYSSDYFQQPELFNDGRVSSDFVIDINNEYNYSRNLGVISNLELPPIITKAAKCYDHTRSTSKSKTEQRSNNNNHHQVIRKSTSINSPGIKLRPNSPRIASKKMQACARKSVSSSNTSVKSKKKKKSLSMTDSFAVVKSSVDPEKDFRESMMEMIMENNIRETKDLEELLACYLQLNSSEYHDIIVKAFEQIWFDIITYQR